MTAAQGRARLPSVFYPSESQLEDHAAPWVLRHPGATLTILGAMLVILQGAGTHWLHERSAPERKKSEAEIRGIRRDIRTLAIYQLEAQRSNRDILANLAEAQNIHVARPPELVEAEEKARKLRNR